MLIIEEIVPGVAVVHKNTGLRYAVVDVSDTDGNRFALGQEESVTTPDVENGKPAPTYE